MPLTKPASYIAALTILALALTGCGGGSGTATSNSTSTTSVEGRAKATAASGSSEPINMLHSTTVNGESTATKLIVRAHGTIAGGAGPIFNLFVNGANLGSTEVRSATPGDYEFDVPNLHAGDKVDIAYINDAKIDGVDRNLYIAQITAGTTYVLPNSRNVVLDSGNGAAAFDGHDVVPGQGSLWGNGALRVTWPEVNMPEKLTVRASAKLANEIGAKMSLRVDGIFAATTEVRSQTLSDYTFAVPTLKKGSRIDVILSNGGVFNGEERSLEVAYLKSGNTLLKISPSSFTYDLGVDQAAFDGVNVQLGQTILKANGALRTYWPLPNLTDSLTVRASGTLADGIGPIVEIRVDDVVLGRAEIRSSDPADVTVPSAPLAEGRRVDVIFVNQSPASAPDRHLNLQYAVSGKTYLLAVDNSIGGAWPAPNLTDTLTIRAKGTASGSAWPSMEVLVDGISIGRTAVDSSDFKEYGFSAPSMKPGRKVDVIFHNDGPVGGIGSVLTIDYLASRDTFLAANSVGNVYDRGSGGAAFDGIDSARASADLTLAGALRISWPTPNITDTLRVRAKATTAGNTGAIMTLWVDGIAVSSVEVKSGIATDYSMPTPKLKSGSLVELTFSNPGTVAGVERSLAIEYVVAGATMITPATTGVNYSGSALRVTWPASNLTDTLTVRAYGKLAGGVGPLMQLSVDGVLIGSKEVRSTIPEDYQFAVPPLKLGSKVDLAFVNDAVIAGEDRNLYVLQLTSGKTYALPTEKSVTFDTGTGDTAFDGIDVRAGTTNITTNGALRFTWPEPNLTEQLTVRASTTSGGEVGGKMIVRIDGVVVATTDVRTTNPTDYVAASPKLSVGSRVEVALANSSTAGTSPKLQVHYLRTSDTLLTPNSTNTIFDLGDGLSAFDGLNTQAGTAVLTRNGALRGRWPAPNMTDTVTIRASGRLADKVGPVMQVRVDGVVLGTAEVRSSAPEDFTFPTLPLKSGMQFDVVFTNAATIGPENRELFVLYAKSGSTVLRPTDASVTFDAGSGEDAFDGNAISAGRTALNASGALRGAWPSPNLTDSILVRARGTLIGGLGPRMQVRVDGIEVGSVDVNSTVFADYRFITPPMTAGRKVDVVFNNDAWKNGEDRNLVVAYLTTQNTTLLPNAAGISYDRGAGEAAFDGVDVVATAGSMPWNGALRATWPVPNITSRVTVRASAVPAGNVWPIMQLWVDGIAVSSTEVRTAAFANYEMPTPLLKAGTKVAVTLANPGVVEGVTRQLSIGYLVAGAAVLEPSSPSVTYAAGNFHATWPQTNLTDRITVRAYARLAGGIGAIMQVRVNGITVASQEVRSTTPADYTFAVPKISAGAKIDIAYVNDERIGDEDRNLYVQYVQTNAGTLIPFGSSAVLDNGTGEAAFDGVSTVATTGTMTTNGALRLTVPASGNLSDPVLYAASRFLQQASFGPTPDEIRRVAKISPSAWIDEQLAIPFVPDFVPAIQARYDQGSAYKPGRSGYTPGWVGQRFWESATRSDDQLRRRMGFALHGILMVSQNDSSLYYHSRAYAQYLDTLNRNALGNYRNLLEEIALSPAMGIYLSHIRNRPENAATGRLPDENFARELMQLFTIGLHELEQDGTAKHNPQGRPIETYTIDDVMALAKAFTGWSWAFPDNHLTEWVFRFGTPDLSASGIQRIDILPMKAYPGQHSTAEKRLFRGKPNETVMPAGSSAQADLKAALDALFNHPNVGPFIGRQLIQRMVTSNPSTAYVSRVAAVFNNNGRGIRGDLAAVARAVLLDPEAVTPPADAIGKLREPVLRITHWMRGFQATSSSGQFSIGSDLEPLSQRPLFSTSVFGYFRPGYVPPNTVFAAGSTTVPEMQIVNETTTAEWVNLAQRMAGGGIGGAGMSPDVVINVQPLANLIANGKVTELIEQLNLLLYSGRMSSALKQDMLEAIVSMQGTDALSYLNRARAALFLALASPEYMVQR